MRTSFVAFSVVCVAVVLTLSACRRDAAPADGCPVVTVSIEPLRYLTEQLAAGRFRVVTMVPRGSSPENYEPSPQQLVDLADSRAYFRVGTLGFERTWMAKFVDNAPDLKVYDTSAGIAPVRSGHRHDGKAVDDTDPHTWMSPENVRLIARHICQALCELDSADASLYRRRLDSLNCRIDSVDSVVRHVLEEHPNDLLGAVCIQLLAPAFFTPEQALALIRSTGLSQQETARRLDLLMRSERHHRQLLP